MLFLVGILKDEERLGGREGRGTYVFVDANGVT